MGCVSYSLRFFGDGRIDKPAMKKAELAASNEIERHRQGVPRAPAGSRRSAPRAPRSRSRRSSPRTAGRRARSPPTGSIACARRRSRRATSRSSTSPGLRDDRAPILPGGLAIMLAVFDGLGLEEMEVAEGALRQGVLYDLLGRVQHHDMREMTVKQFMRRYHVDGAQGERVEALALTLYRALVERAARGRRAGARVGRAAARDRAFDRARRLPQALRVHPVERRHARASRRTSRQGSRGSCSRTAASSRRSRGCRRAAPTGRSSSACGSRRSSAAAASTCRCRGWARGRPIAGISLRSPPAGSTSIRSPRPPSRPKRGLARGRAAIRRALARCRQGAGRGLASPRSRRTPGPRGG